MAKAKKAKAKKKAKKAKKVSSSRPGTTVPAASVVQFIRMLVKEGHADDFEASARDEKIVVSLDGKGTNWVRKFLANNAHLRGPQGAMAMAVRDPCPGNPFGC